MKSKSEKAKGADLSDRRGDGKKKPLTLRTFRKRIEAGESFDRHDWGGCGCALDGASEHNAELTHRRDL